MIAAAPGPDVAVAGDPDTAQDNSAAAAETAERVSEAPLRESAKDLASRMKARLQHAVDTPYGSTAGRHSNPVPCEVRASGDGGGLVRAAGGGAADAAEVAALHAALDDLNAVLAMPVQQDDLARDRAARDAAASNRSWARRIWQRDPDAAVRAGPPERGGQVAACLVPDFEDPTRAQAAAKGWLARRQVRAIRTGFTSETATATQCNQERLTAVRIIQRAFKRRPAHRSEVSVAVAGSKPRLPADCAACRIQRLFRVWCLGRRVSVLAKQSRSRRQRTLLEDAARAVQRGCRRASARRAAQRMQHDAALGAPEAEREFAAGLIQLWWRCAALTRRAGAISRDARALRLGVMRSEAALAIQRAHRRRVASPARTQ
jgi:hypothetical protein